MRLAVEYTRDDARRLLVALLMLEVVMVVGSLVGDASTDRSWSPVADLLRVDHDLSIPSWFSSMQLFVTGAVLLVAARSNRQPHAIASSTLLAGGVVFLLMSLDEGAVVHERITEMAKSTGSDWMLIRGHGAWIMVYGVAAVLGVVFAAPRLLRLWKNFRTETLIGIAGAALVALGAVGMELISYLYVRSGPLARWLPVQEAAEELLEMAGVSVMLHAALVLAGRVASPPDAGASADQPLRSPGAMSRS